MNAAILFCFILFVSSVFFFFFFLIFLSIPFFKLKIGLNSSLEFFARRILYKGPSTYSLYPRLTSTGRLGGEGVRQGMLVRGIFGQKQTSVFSSVFTSCAVERRSLSRTN